MSPVPGAVRVCGADHGVSDRHDDHTLGGMTLHRRLAGSGAATDVNNPRHVCPDHASIRCAFLLERISLSPWSPAVSA